MKNERDRYLLATLTRLNHHRRLTSYNLKALAFLALLLCSLYTLEFISRSGWTSDNDGLQAHMPMFLADKDMLAPLPGEQHPIEILVAEARQKFTQMVSKQSRTLEEATAEYQRRYNRQPPPGFDSWFLRAVKRNTTVIDNYDTIMESLEPFWRFPPKEIHARARLAIATHNQMSNISIRNHQVFVSEESDEGHTSRVVQWMHPLLEYLSDMDLAMSDTDEPRVVVPHDRLHSQEIACVSPSRERFEFHEFYHQNFWTIATQSCPVDSPSRSFLLPKFAPSTEIRFIRNVTGSKDICKTPNAANLHGLFIAPNVIKWSDALLPIFSRSSVSTFQDIIMPAIDYTSTYENSDFDDPKEPAWEQKANKLYWTGSARDGGAPKGKWRQMQRFRLVGLANNHSQPISLLGQTEQGAWQPYNDTISSLYHLFNVNLISYFDCDSDLCATQRAEYAFGDVEPASHAYDHKFVFDLDGHAFTERFYRLLNSHSTVFKQTIFREWHDDRLVPWLHYVPISLGMGELAETVRFLSSERGEGIARMIAEEGRNWQKRALREEDIELAWHRIMLEYARLVDEGREGGGECDSGDE